MAPAAPLMISATGNSLFLEPDALSSGRFRGCRGGFTLIEIILVIGLIVLIAGAAVYQMDDINKDERPLKDWVRDGLYSARIAALESKREVQLSYNKEKKALEVTLLEEVLVSVDVPPNHNGEMEMGFYPLLPDEGSGSFDYDYADEPIEAIRFEASGASTPVKILIELEGEELELRPDAFASYFIEEEG